VVELGCVCRLGRVCLGQGCQHLWPEGWGWQRLVRERGGRREGIMGEDRGGICVRGWQVRPEGCVE
jgi:hypothetical protein